jgi:hypothetical protein
MFNSAILVLIASSVALAIASSVVLNRLRKSHPGIYSKWEHADTVGVTPWQAGDLFHFSFSFAFLRKFQQHELDPVTKMWCELLFLVIWAALISGGFVVFGLLERWL